MHTDPHVWMQQMFAAIDWNYIFTATVVLLCLGIGIAVLLAGLIRVLDNWRLPERRATAKVIAKCREREHTTEDWKYHPVAQMHVPLKQFHLEAFVLQVDAGWGPVEIKVPRHLYRRVESGDEIKIAYVRSRIKDEPRLTRVVDDAEAEQ